MNKKTKSFAVGLVAVLCFLLVFAIGFGVTGAWYQAQRRASGTVKMDQGIYLKFTNLKTLDANENKDLSNKLGGQLLQDNAAADPLTDLAVVPAQLVTIKNPTIAAAKGSVPFYVRVKVTYTAKYFVDAARSGLESTAVPISEATMQQLFGADLSGQLQMPDTGWVAGGDGYWYYGTEKTKAGLTALTATGNADGDPVSLFKNGNLQFADWTEGRTDVEAGGPTVVVTPDPDGEGPGTAVVKEIGQVIVTVDIEVIQSQNTTEEALFGTAGVWKAV